jgi:hypothetical protein
MEVGRVFSCSQGAAMKKACPMSRTRLVSVLEVRGYSTFFTLEKILPRVSRLFSLSFFEIQ